MKSNVSIRHLTFQVILQFFKAGQAFCFRDLKDILQLKTLKKKHLLKKCVRLCLRHRLLRRELRLEGSVLVAWFIPNQSDVPWEQNSQLLLLSWVERCNTRYNGNRNRLRGVL